MMPNPKNNSSDAKNNNADSKNNNSASKNNASDPKNNNADQKNNNSATKSNNADLTKSNSASRRDNADSKTNPDSKTNADAPPQGDGGVCNLPPPSGAGQQIESQSSRNGNKVYKSGPLYLSSKGIGWTSWKKRWFILTQTSLVFFRSDPNSVSEKGGEANLTLGGIDLNSSGSVVVKADKKLLTVQFPDGRDGRAFTLKAETSEDLFEWKAALEEALANAPSAGTGTGQTGILKNENADVSQEQSKDRSPPKSLVLGRPVLLALEDIDGTPSFLEKALRYVEEHGVKVEGILRQAADVEHVERRIREYEQGKTEFTADEDGHVIGDCIKYVLRELPSSPVPASCCKSLLQAFRTDRTTRVSAMRAAICDTFPEPNRRLLQRILVTMQAVAENKAVNRMSVSAVAACMSPLLLRPLLQGEVELENEFSMGGDGSAQLMQAAAAANHAQAIIITLLEEYDNIFGEGDMMSDLYTDSDASGSESEELSDEEAYEDDDYEDGDYTSDGSHADEDSEHASSISYSESGDGDSYQHDGKGFDDLETSEGLLSTSSRRSPHHPDSDSVPSHRNDRLRSHKSRKARKKFSIENIDVIAEERDEILRLEALKADLIKKIEAEARQNAILKEELLSKKDVLGERHLALEQDVAALKEQLQKERELRKVLESGLMMSKKALPLPAFIDEKTKADLEDIAKTEAEVISLQQKLDDLGIQLNQHRGVDQSFAHDQGKARDKDREASTTSRRNKDKHSNKEHHDKHQLHSFSSKLDPNQQIDSACKGEPSMSKSTSTTVRRSNSRGEAASTNSALSKLTNRLNFLKERRNQIANELQSGDKEANKGQSSQKHDRGHRKDSEPPQSLDESHNQSSEKGKVSDSQNNRSAAADGSSSRHM